VGGAALLIAAVCCLLLALQWGGTVSPWKSSRIIGLFVGFGLLFSVFGILQWKLEDDATTPLRILRQRSIYMGSSFVTFTNMAIFTVRLHLGDQSRAVPVAESH
jgi:fatty acid desaturase